MAQLLSPFLVFVTAQTTLTVTAAYTGRDSRFRYAGFVFLLLCAYYMPSLLASYSAATGWAGRVLATGVATNAMGYLDRLILRKWDFADYELMKQKPETTRTATGSADVLYRSLPATRMEFGSEVAGDARGIGRSWQVKNVPRFSKLQPSFVPSKTAFLTVNSISLLACFYIHNNTQSWLCQLHASTWESARSSMGTSLASADVDALGARVLISAGYWGQLICFIQFFYSLAGVLATLPDESQIRLFPPLFGSFDDAYSLRNFWGTSWHQALRSSFEGVSSFVAHDILCLARTGLIQRYSKIMLCFMVSGIVHLMADLGGDAPAANSGSMQFFCMQALGIIFEDIVVSVHKSFVPTTPASASATFSRVIGYIWVLAFLAWTTPIWVFPIYRNMRVEDSQLSWTAVQPVLFGRHPQTKR